MVLGKKMNDEIVDPVKPNRLNKRFGPWSVYTKQIDKIPLILAPSTTENCSIGSCKKSDVYAH